MTMLNKTIGNVTPEIVHGHDSHCKLKETVKLCSDPMESGVPAGSWAVEQASLDGGLPYFQNLNFSSQDEMRAFIKSLVPGYVFTAAETEEVDTVEVLTDAFVKEGFGLVIPYLHLILRGTENAECGVMFSNTEHIAGGGLNYTAIKVYPASALVKLIPANISSVESEAITLGTFLSIYVNKTTGAVKIAPHGITTTDLEIAIPSTMVTSLETIGNVVYMTIKFFK